MFNKITTKSKPLFCEEYWAKQSIKKLFKTKKLEHVSHSFDLHDVNYFLLGSNDAVFYMNTQQYGDDELLNIREVISKSDKEFKILKPIGEKMTLWRGINGFNNFPKRFQQSYDTKVGDIIYMQEYAYASESKSYAEGFAKINSDKGILYEIEVPKGAKLSTKQHYIFPRYSKFECTGTEEQERFKLIKLKYLSKDESLLNYFIKKIFIGFNK